MRFSLLFGLAVALQLIHRAFPMGGVIIINNVMASKAITKRMDEMKAANLIQDEKIDKKIDDLQASIKKLEPPKEEEKKIGAMDVGKAVGEAVEGLPDIVAGFQTKNYQAVMKGGLKVVTSIVGLFVPGSVMAVANLVLKAFTTIFSLFTGAKTKNPKPPIISALEKFRVENIQNEIAEIEYLWNMMIKSIAHFEDYLNHNGVITEELASQFYSNSFLKLGIFGKLERMIRDYCITRDHTDGASDSKENIIVCMSLLGAYSRLAVSRGVLLMRMAGIVMTAEEHFIELHAKSTDVKLKEKFDRKRSNMESYKKNFVYLAGQQRSMDKDVLRFLGDPLNQFQSKRIIFELFSHSHKYPVIMNYLLGLDSQFEFMIDNDFVILCSETKLAGLCRKQSITDKFQEWDGISSTKSWFVPKGLQISMEDEKKNLYGPFIGMMAYSPESVENFISFKVDKMDAKLTDASENIMICNGNSMCDTIEIEKFESYKITEYHGISYTKMKLMDIPSGVKVTLTAADPNTKINVVVGPFIQDNIDKCFSEWVNLKVEKAKDDEDGRKMIVVCGPEEQFCTQFEPGKTVESDKVTFFWFKTSSSTDVRCRPTVDDYHLDITIPVGRVVTVKKDKALYGPYAGPAYYPRMNVEKVTIQVEDLWLGDKNGRKRSPISRIPIAADYPNKNSGLQFFTADHHSHHHHKHRHAAQNKTMDVYNKDDNE